MKKVGMQELDNGLAKIVEQARTEPVQVLRYGRPWVWVVGHALWNSPPSASDLVPTVHPLRHIRSRADAALAQAIDELYRLAQLMELVLPIELLARALLLQLLYSIRCHQELTERIGYDLSFRWFVGLEIEQALPAADVLGDSLDKLLEQAVVVDLLQGLMMETAKDPAHQRPGRIVPDFGLLSLWMARHVPR